MASPTPLSKTTKALRGTLERAREARRESRSARSRSSATLPKIPRRAYVAIADRYVGDVVSGTEVAGKWVRLACERQRRDLQRAATDPSWPYVWDPTQAAAVCRFVERLPHVEGTWSTSTITLEPWQIFVLTTVFGWRKKTNGGRRFTEGYFEVARKAAKTTLSAGMGLYHLAEEREPGGQLKCGATTGQQARIVFGIMQRMVERAPWLRAKGLRVFANSITFEPAGEPLATAQPINAKASTQDGLNPSFVILDEGHALPDHRLRNVLKSAMGGRENPFTWLPTTAGYNLLGPAYETRTFVMKVLERVFDADHVFGVIYTIDEGDDWRDETVWRKANPMLGTSPKVEWMRQYAAEAQQAPSLAGEFQTKCLSVWLQSASAWINMAHWDACADATLHLDQFAGEPCWIGGDLAQLDDLAALALLFRRGDLVYAFVKFYLPRLVVEERAKAVPVYRAWVNSQILTLTEGEMIDYNVIEGDIRAATKRFRVRAIRLETFGAAQLASRLAEDGLPASLIDKNARTFTPPARDFETRVRHRRFRHDGNSCLKWNVSNAVVRRGVDDTLLPKKERAESPHKIDGVDAILQASSAMLVDVADKPRRRVVAKVYTATGFEALT